MSIIRGYVSLNRISDGESKCEATFLYLLYTYIDSFATVPAKKIIFKLQRADHLARRGSSPWRYPFSFLTRVSCAAIHENEEFDDCLRLYRAMDIKQDLAIDHRKGYL